MKWFANSFFFLILKFIPKHISNPLKKEKNKRIKGGIITYRLSKLFTTTSHCPLD